MKDRLSAEGMQIQHDQKDLVLQERVRGLVCRNSI